MIHYLVEQIRNHIALFFSRRAGDLFEKTDIQFLPLNEALLLRKPCIAIPTDIPAPLSISDPYKVIFNGTHLTLWNRIDHVFEGDWLSLPDEINPLWYRHCSGTLIPAYNMFRNVTDLLTLREEKQVAQRDVHGRFSVENSPRHIHNLLEVPVFNEAIAAIVAACEGLSNNGFPRFCFNEVEPSVTMVLSHDCDILLGNDWITQAIRCYRIFNPIFKARLPNIENIWWIMRNAVRPKDYYLDNIIGLIDLESILRLTSTFYFINGTGGRFGARSGTKAIDQAIKNIPSDWKVGIHYNYDTYLNSENFIMQKQALERVLQRDIICGRAHYLRFDPEESWRFLSNHGIRYDESVGYHNFIGYRCGIAGVFQPFNTTKGEKIDIWELPLVVMENALMRQYGEDSIAAFQRLIAHLSCIGGALSVLFHPGQFFNPEFPQYLGLYRKLLEVAKQYASNCSSAASLCARRTERQIAN